MKYFFRISKCCLAILIVLSLQLSVSAQIADNLEIAALLDLYNSTTNNNVSPWTSNFNGVDYRWDRNKLMTETTFDNFNLIYNSGNQTYTTNDLKGVTLDANKDVTAINLMPWTGARGAIPASINNLQKLKVLQIQSYSTNYATHNQITGTLPNLSGLVNLETLNLSGNDCTGVVSWIGSNGTASNKLVYIDLSSYHVTPGIRLAILPEASFSNLINLQILNLNYVEFTTVASPTNNLLSPNFDFLDNLTTLNLIGCNLVSGSFPTQFGTMAKLTSLHLGSNPIQNVPSPIGTLSTLTHLYLTSISLQTLPSNFNLLDKLVYLDLYANGLTNNTAFFDMVELLKGCLVLNQLNLSANNFSELTTNFNLLTALRTLNLSLNPIGTSDLLNLQGSMITALYLEACNLTSKLPSTLINLASLNTLTLNNGIIGSAYTTHPLRNAIDLNSAGIENVIKNLQFLRNLSINWHAIAGTGPLPAWFGTGYMNLIQSLDLSSNAIQLPFSANMFLMDALITLYMYNNSLAGSLPPNFNCGEFPNLAYLHLGNNQLTSVSATQALPDLSVCPQLRSLDISNNQFTGDVPDYLRSLPLLNSINVVNNSFVYLPNFTVRPNGFPPLSSVQASLNYFDFEDLDHYYNSACTQLIPSLSYAPQKTPQGPKGNPVTFSQVEGFSITLQFQAPGANNYYQWERGDGTILSPYQTPLDLPIITNDTYTISNVTPGAAGVYKTRIKNRCLSGLEFIGNDITLTIIPPLCQSEIPANAGTFKLDKLTGSIVFERNDCPGKIPITCVFGPASTIDNVVSAKAVSHSDNWSYAYLNLPPASSTNPFDNAERGKWRPQASYVYNTQLNLANDKTYNGGTFKYKPFNWRTNDKSNNPGWIRVNKIEKYTPDGEAVEERNALDIMSAAKFGYKNAVPYLVAQNAEYSSVLFESFENNYGGKFEDGMLLNGGELESNTGIAHAGKNSFKLTNVSNMTVRSFKVTGQFKSKGIQAKLWVKGTITNSIDFNVFDQSNVLLGTVPLIWVANSGEWALYEAIIQPSVYASLSVGSTINLVLRHTAIATIWIDDLRIQPKDSEMTAYVYDAINLRLLTVFDDQHFGLFYQYNAEGKLVRKMVETERGIKTIQETQYNTVKTLK